MAESEIQEKLSQILTRLQGNQDDSVLSLIDPEERAGINPDTKEVLRTIKAEQCEPTIASQIPDLMSAAMPVLLSPHSTAQEVKEVANKMVIALNHLAIEHQRLRLRHDRAILEIVYAPIRKEKFDLRHGAYVVYRDKPNGVR
jgi:hypothetical protein